MEEKADKGSAFSFSLISHSNTSKFRAKTLKKGREIFTIFWENKSLRYLEMSKILCTFAHS